MTRRIRTAALCAALVALAGCGGGTTDVSGKVTHQGKAVVYGTVLILSDGAQPKSGVIGPDGTFTVSGVRVGPAKVAVSSPRPPGSEPAKKARAGRDGDDDKPPPEETPAAPEVIKSWFAIPDKYGDPAKSGLTVEIKAGQPLELDLK